MDSPRNIRLKVIFSFLLGVALTALFFTARLDTKKCTEKVYGNRDPNSRNLAKSGGGMSAPSASSPSSISQSSTTVDSIKSTAPPKLTEKQVTQSATPPSIQYSPTFTIPPLKYGKRTHPVPSEASRDSVSMTNRTSCAGTGYCRKNLSPKEEVQFSECTKKCTTKSSTFGELQDGDCHFMKGQGRLPVALASFPGSGNTWARGLMEKVTGICTGAIYCDCGLRNGGFTGEGVKGPSVLAMKTHNINIQFVGGHFFSNSRLPYGAAVLLVRDPRGALVAEWNREKSKKMISQSVSNHFAYVGQEYFGDNKDWDEHIHTKLPRWPQGIVNLLQEARTAHRPVYVLIFEDLKADTVREMKRVTDFLGFTFTEHEVSERLEAGYSKFYRNHTAEFSHFTPEQELYIQDVVASTSKFMKDNGIHDMFPRIDDYL